MVFQAKSLDEITKGASGTPTSQGQGDMENSAEEAEMSGHGEQRTPSEDTKAVCSGGRGELYQTLLRAQEGQHGESTTGFSSLAVVGDLEKLGGSQGWM